MENRNMTTEEENTPPINTKIEGAENQDVYDKPSCWGVVGDQTFIPSYKNIDTVPNGLYSVIFDESSRSYALKKYSFETDELYELPSFELNEIITDISNFWLNYEKYQKYNFIHKRGILMYGEPGCGKSGIIQLITKSIINDDGIAINIKNQDDLDTFSTFIPTFRKIEPKRKLIVILEDIDSIVGEGRYYTSIFLNMLDGITQIENVVYLATTNYPEKLEERITNRPSRFDRRFKIDLPNDEIRKNYILNKIQDDDIDKIDIDLWVNKTKGMSLSHIKELFISVIICGKNFNDVINNLTDMKIKPTINKQSPVGFGLLKD
jgi:AAA+ superfamily predicted ATPase